MKFHWMVIIWLLRVFFMADASDNTGREFIIGFMDNKVHDVNRNMKLFITTKIKSIVNVEVKGPLHGNLDEQFTVTKGFVKEVIIDKMYRIEGPGLSTKGILITSDEDITVFGVNDQSYSTDAFLALPTESIGQEYYTITSYPSSSVTQVLIVGIYNTTSVSIQLPSGPDTLSISYRGQNYTPGGSIHEVINRFGTLQIQGTGDLSGSHILSDQTLSVFSGNLKTYVGGSGSADHLAEQLTPVNTWGQSFATVPIPQRTRGDYFKFVASKNETNITFTCNDTQQISSYNVELENAGNFAQLPISSDKYCHVLASKPIMLIQFVLRPLSSEPYTDPAMVLLTPINQYGTYYPFRTPKTANGNVYARNLLLFVVKTAEINKIMLDEDKLPGGIECIKIPNTEYCGGFIEITDGSHIIRHDSPISTFGGILYGRADRASYAYPIGMRMAKLNEECNKTTSYFGDGVDNDCDKFVDEELCTGDYYLKDEDNDGLIDEDCAMPNPVDGNWTVWSTWGSCLCTCLYSNKFKGFRSRERYCTNPSPAFGGVDCEGDRDQYDPIECMTVSECSSQIYRNQDERLFQEEKSIKNMLPSNDILWSMPSTGLIECSLKCVLDQCCQSYFYDSIGKQCHGIKHLNLTSSLQMHPGMKYFMNIN